MQTTSDPTITFGGVEAILASVLPDYESRSQQQAFAAAVEEALSSKIHLIAEAGCGTGKSLGYLIPAILSGKRVIVATATKALQDQIAGKDLPFLQRLFHEHLGIDFTYAVLKGRSNYLCRSKLAELDPAEFPLLPQVIAQVGQADADPTFVGERDQFEIEVDDRDWRRLVTGVDECPGKKDCPFGETCLAERAKQVAKAAQVVVVNHALLFTDLAVREATGGTVAMLDNYDYVIFDEAHEAEEYATSTLGASFSEGTVRSLIAEVRNFVRQVDPDKSELVDDAGSNLMGAMTSLWKVLTPGRIRLATVEESEDQYVAFHEALVELAKATYAISLKSVPREQYERSHGRKERLQRRAASAVQTVENIIVAEYDEWVRWVEVERVRTGGERMVIKTAPIDVSDFLRKVLFSKTTCILVSATMEVAGSFDYIATRLGIDSYTSMNAGSPFDFARQSLFFVPTNIAEPTPKNRVAWESEAVALTERLVTASDGRALLLFTSRKQMDTAYSALAPRLPFVCLKQGQAPNRVLAERFMADTHSVLFAVRSFFTGVDFQGEACSLVVIDKLPFPVPTEPITEARCDLIEASGGNAFRDYTIPVMSLILKQGHGRLIRHRNDIGVFALLDPRIKTKGYGNRIRQSLPPSKFTTDVTDVESFFGKGQ